MRGKSSVRENQASLSTKNMLVETALQFETIKKYKAHKLISEPPRSNCKRIIKIFFSLTTLRNLSAAAARESNLDWACPAAATSLHGDLTIVKYIALSRYGFENYVISVQFQRAKVLKCFRNWVVIQTDISFSNISVPIGNEGKHFFK